MLNQILRLYNSAVFWKFVSSGLRFGGFIFILPLTLHKLTSDELGMWYTMQAATGMAILLDMGFSPTASRMASYLWGGARNLEAYGLSIQSQTETAQPNLQGLGKLVGTMRWFYLALGLAGAGILAVSITPWIVTQHSAGGGDFLYVWIFLLASIIVNSIGAVWPNLLTGIGAVRSAEIIFVTTTSINYIFSALFLILGFKLWAVAGGAFLAAVLTRIIGRRAFLKRVGPTFQASNNFDRKVFLILWPNAWRSGLVGLGGFGLMYGSRIICATSLDLATAASFSLTQQLFLAISQISSAWFQVKLPLISSLRVQNQNSLIRKILAKQMALTFLTYAFLAAIFIVFAPIIFPLIKSNTALLSVPLLCFAALVYLAETQANLSYAIVLTANRNPFVFPSLVTGMLAILAYWFLAPIYGALGLLLGQFMVGCSFAYWLPLTLAVKSVKVK